MSFGIDCNVENLISANIAPQKLLKMHYLSRVKLEFGAMECPRKNGEIFV